MKKTLIASALLFAFGAAQAQVVVVGGSTNTGIVQVGASTVNAGPHVAGKPGIGTDGSSRIDLAGIDAFTFKGTTASSSIAFRRYQLLGYTHTAPGGGTITTNFNWFKIPTISKEVYFGLATISGSPNSQHAAFYVGDQAGYAVPTSSTNYAAVGFLAVPATSASTPVILTGNLRYNTTAGTLNSANSTTGVNAPLTGTGTTLQVNTTVNAVAGTFAGSSSYNGGSITGSSVNGKFFGSGTTSAVAGTANGTGYVAAFGGIKN